MPVFWMSRVPDLQSRVAAGEVVLHPSQELAAAGLWSWRPALCRQALGPAQSVLHMPVQAHS